MRPLNGNYNVHVTSHIIIIQYNIIRIMMVLMIIMIIIIIVTIAGTILY